MADSFELTIRADDRSFTLTLGHDGAITAAPTDAPAELQPPSRVRGFSQFDSGVDLVWIRAADSPELAAGMKLALPDRIATAEVEALTRLPATD